MFFDILVRSLEKGRSVSYLCVFLLPREDGSLNCAFIVRSDEMLVLQLNCSLAVYLQPKIVH